MNPKLCPQFSRVAIVSSITPGTGRRYNGSGFFFLSGILLVGLLCDGSKHCLTSAPNKHNPTFSIVFYSTAAASSFLHNHVKFYLSPKFLNKDCDRHQRGMAAFALKLMWLFVMVASLVVLPLPSDKAWNANSGKTVL